MQGPAHAGQPSPLIVHWLRPAVLPASLGSLGKGRGGIWEEPPAASAASKIFITLDSTVTFTLLKEDQNTVSPVLGVTLQAWLRIHNRIWIHIQTLAVRPRAENANSLAFSFLICKIVMMQ